MGTQSKEKVRSGRDLLGVGTDLWSWFGWVRLWYTQSNIITNFINDQKRCLLIRRDGVIRTGKLN